ncbi:MAG: hypothetical protein HQ581_11835 [Planctomycetes bacterium]|nr:hypothetical protein [Planctomycetota bacterium]
MNYAWEIKRRYSTQVMWSKTVEIAPTAEAALRCAATLAEKDGKPGDAPCDGRGTRIKVRCLDRVEDTRPMLSTEGVDDDTP